MKIGPLAERHRAEAARLFWGAFRGKLGRIMWPEHRALGFLEAAVQPAWGIAATEGERLLGVVGFKDARGGFLGGDFALMARHYGWFGAAWRGPLLELFDRELAPGQLLMDGIFVAAPARGRGVGTALIAAVKAEARQRGCTELRLDVVAGNPRAKALYARLGFEERGTLRAGVFAPLMGFSSATTMIARLG